MLRRWFIEDKGPSEGYKWENNEAVVNWLLEQKTRDNSIISHNLLCVKKDAMLHSIKEAVDVSIKQSSAYDPGQFNL